jgi:hypothetical protein
MGPRGRGGQGTGGGDVANMRVCASGVFAACVAALCAGRTAAGPFDFWYTNNPLIVARGEVSVFDVRASTVDRNRFFITHWGFGGGANWGIAEYEIKRVRGKWIRPLADEQSRTENRLWTSSFGKSVGDFTKSLDILSEDAETVRILATAEDNDTAFDGSVQLFTVDRSSYTNYVAVDLWKDMSGQRTDGGAGYHPEGIAIDRVNHWVAVVTDDGTTNPPLPPRTQGVRIFEYNPTNFTVGATVTNFGLVPSGNGREALTLSNGLFLVCAGTAGDNQGIWRVDPWTGAATQIVDRAAIEEHELPGAVVSGVQDMLVFRGYLYLLQYAGLILAFEWDASAQTVVDTTVDAVFDLQSLFMAKFGINARPGGLDLTLRNELLVCSLNPSGAWPIVVAFDAVPVPKPFHFWVR